MIDTPLFPYVHGDRDHDLLVAQAWAMMDATGDTRVVLSSGNRSLAGLYRIVQPPTLCYLRAAPAAQGGVWFMVWFTPFLDGLAMGLWITPSLRRTKRALLTLIEAMDLAFEKAPFLIAVTKQAHHLGEERRMGFTVMDPAIENAYDGERTWVMACSRESYAAARAGGFRRLPRDLSAAELRHRVGEVEYGVRRLHKLACSCDTIPANGPRPCYPCVVASRYVTVAPNRPYIMVI